MKNTTLPLFCICLLLASAAVAQPEKASQLVRRFLLKEGVPGCVQVKDSLWADFTEVTNYSWRQYLGHLRNDSLPVVYQSAIPTTVLNSVPDRAYYAKHHFRMFPVVGVSFAHARNYAVWRTQMVNQQPKMQQLNAKLAQYGYRLSLQFRLPSPEEWSYLSKQTFARTAPENWAENMPALTRTELMFIPSYMRLAKIEYAHEIPNMVMVAANGLLPNIQNNVSEMTLTEGLACGANYASEETLHRYEYPETWLGFRCVCVVVWEKLWE